MKLATLLSSVFVTFGLLVSGGEGQDGPKTGGSPSELKIAMDKPVYRPGEPIHILLVTSNKSSRGTVLGTPGSEPQFNVTCNKKPVEKTRYARNTEEEVKNRIGSRATSKLDGDRTFKEDLLLSRWLDLTTIGTYEVTVSRRVAEVGDSGFDHIIQSNAIIFEIRE